MRVPRTNLLLLCKRLLVSAAIVSASACGGGSGGEAPRSQVGLESTGTAPGSVGEKVPEEAQRVIPNEEVRPFRSNSQYASSLYPCIISPEFIDELCTLSELPYIGQNTDLISVDQVMQRVLVSHDWMGVRFEEMLYRMPPDLVQLFAPVTSIVIGSDVRPSSFTPALGMMMLDPEYLWLNTDERNTISVVEDFRTDFGSGLQFIGLSRAMVGDEYTSYFWPEDTERKHDYIEVSLARLLYHELAHANDYVQRQALTTLDDNLTTYAAVEQLEGSRISTLLVEDSSLTTPNQLFDELANVQFRDEPPTVEHSTTPADFVGGMLAAAGKIQFYSYASAQEDVATLYEAAMMKYHYDVDTHVGFANKPADEDNAECDDYIVAWGVRNRLASTLVIPRANFVVNSIMQDSANISDVLNNQLGPVVPLREGDGWCESRTLNPSLTFSDQPAAREGGRPAEILRSMRQRFK